MLQFLKDFVKRRGHLVFSSSILAKLAGLISNVAVVNMLSQDDFGDVTYARTILFVASPFIAAGMNHSLLRFGSISEQRHEKKSLYEYSIAKGSAYVLPIVALLLLASPLITINKRGAWLYLGILSFSLFSNSVFQLFQSYLRILDMNGAYSRMTNWYSFILLFFTLIATWFFGAIGFVSGLVLAPIFTFIWANWPRIKIISLAKLKSKLPTGVSTSEYLRYGLFVGFGAIASQLTLMTDNLVIGNLIEDSSQLAIYRVGTMLPFNLMFLPVVFMVTDFVNLARHSTDRKYLFEYLMSYWKLFGLICIAVIAPLYFFAEEILLLLFRDEYKSAVPILQLLSLGLIGSFMLRIPLGNILNAIGKAKWTLYNSYFVLTLNIILSSYLTLSMGIVGAAIATCAVLWASGIVSLVQMVYYLKGLSHTSDDVVKRKM